jgi:hypothetical protein
MPKFLERKLKREYGSDSATPFKVMNALGYMRGSKETAAGREASRKHRSDVRTARHKGISVSAAGARRRRGSRRS